MSWGGSAEDFVRLLQVGYAVAKETNPNAIVHMAGIMHWYNEHWFGQFIDAVTAQPGAAANGYWFDIATLHLYHEPEKIHDVTAHYLAMMRGRGLHQPIWIAETNAYLSRATPEEQAFFVFQALSLGIAAGAERIAVYKMADTETDSAADPEPFGLVQMDGSRRPAFKAYQVAATHLAGFRSGTWERRDDISVVTIDRGERTTTVAWARIAEPRTAMIPARTTRALLADVWGSAHYVYPERGYYFVQLPAARCAEGCTIGGAPSIIVEEAPASANTAPAPRSPTPVSVGPTTSSATPVPGAAFTATPTFTATPPPTATQTQTPTATSTATPTASPTMKASPTQVWTPTASPKPTRTLVVTKRQTSAPTVTPSPTAASMPMSDIPPGHSWPLAGVLVLVLALATTALAVERGPLGAPAAHRVANKHPEEEWLGAGSGSRGAAALYVRWLVIIMMLGAAVLLISNAVLRP